MVLTKTTRSTENEVCLAPEDIKLVTFMNCDKCIHGGVCKWRDKCMSQQTLLSIPTIAPILQVSVDVKCAEFIESPVCVSRDKIDANLEGDSK